LPSIANYFGVSIDYLFYGQDYAYSDIYNQIFDKVAEHPQMSKEAFQDALTVFAYADHGVGRWNLKGRAVPINDEPLHFSNENGLSLLSGKGYGAILTRAFFENVSGDTAAFAQTIFPVLSERNCLIVCMTIISMSDISFGELKEKTRLDESVLREVLDRLIESRLVIEKKSKHKSVGLTYDIAEMYHTCLCLLLATVEMQRISLKGISCCMGYGDYPIKL